MNAARLRACGLVVALLFLVGRCVVAQAASPLNILSPFARTGATPNQSYQLTQDNGPWLIMATTFEGQTAAEDARKLAQELRTKHKVQAYTHKMTFDFTDKLVGRGMDRFGQQQRMRYSRKGKVDEVAVLVGDFSSFDDPQANKLLDWIKHLKPDSLSAADSKAEAQLQQNGIPRPDATGGADESAGSRTFAALRNKLLPDGSERKKMGPMRLAFVTTNPLLPASYFQPKGVDRLVIEMNKGLEHSLLDCPGPYTVRVATFRGNVVIDPRRIKEIEDADGPSASKKGDVQQLGEMQSRLHKGAIKAHEVTVYLRASGVEAYEFHDRDSSIVAVGSFTAPGTPTADGGLQYSPAVQQVIDRFKEQPYRYPNGTTGPVMPQMIKFLNACFDPVPIVIEVPRHSYGSDYARGTLRVQ